MLSVSCIQPVQYIDLYLNSVHTSSYKELQSRFRMFVVPLKFEIVVKGYERLSPCMQLHRAIPGGPGGGKQARRFLLGIGNYFVYRVVSAVK